MRGDGGFLPVKNGKKLPVGLPDHGGIGPIRTERVVNPNRAERRALAKQRRAGGGA